MIRLEAIVTDPNDGTSFTTSQSGYSFTWGCATNRSLCLSGGSTLNLPTTQTASLDASLLTLISSKLAQDIVMSLNVSKQTTSYTAIGNAIAAITLLPTTNTLPLRVLINVCCNEMDGDCVAAMC